MGDCQKFHLDRNLPPEPPESRDGLRSTLLKIVDNGCINGIMRHHRYGDNETDQLAASKWLGERFGDVDLSGRIVLTNGAKNGALLLLSLVAKSGDTVVTEELSALAAWEIPRLLGIRVIGTPIDAHGILPDAFEQICRLHAPRALFTVPTLHNPTTHVLGLDRRKDISRVAEKFGVSIIEDDICGMLLPDAPLPFACIGPSNAWYVTGVGKTLSPGFRFGYIVAPTSQHARDFIARFRSTTTWVPSPLSAEIIAHWIADGTAKRVLAAVREEVTARQILATSLLNDCDIVAKPWALNLWLRFPMHQSAADLLLAARREGIFLGAASIFNTKSDRPTNSVRICLGGPSLREELQTALQRLSNLI
ncbi:aminotransferase-like domain-containing protein [Bradyrhizobium sp. CCBAU 11386]|uniref:aminotransferase-like domain-containing protein n=1 Tax=Bradyrhizobium sp. CCBAU 11386 TaxID=1630837 RepID=UPI0023030480|nr:PLP-dependent aminotransferase family protein [Bradyrhizobium sp. CCBAU 11386]